jgi:hypothetical protein
MVFMSTGLATFGSRWGLQIRVERVGVRRLIMAKVIEFYIPKDFRKKTQPAASEKVGQLIEFSLPPKKSA